MLVLTRKLGEKIVVNDNLTIEVLEVDPRFGGRVRLGFVAPPDVVIRRQEVHDRLTGRAEGR
jgi:carbon storage regulator